MASNHLFPLLAFSSCLIISHFLTSQSLASDLPLTTPVSPETICNSTPHPSYCISILPHNNANVYDFGRFSINYALSQSYKLLDIIETYLQRASILPQPAIQALEDCKSLQTLNIDFLSTSIQTVNKTSGVLPTSNADDVQTLLSAVLTNQQTCSDGIESLSSIAASVIRDLFAPVSNNINLYSISLALVTKGWVPKDKHGEPKQPNGRFGFGKGRLNMKMSSRARGIYDGAVNRRGRRLLQVGDEEVLVKDVVVVSKDGSGNCCGK